MAVDGVTQSGSDVAVPWCSCRRNGGTVIAAHRAIEAGAKLLTIFAATA